MSLCFWLCALSFCACFLGGENVLYGNILGNGTRCYESDMHVSPARRNNRALAVRIQALLYRFFFFLCLCFFSFSYERVVRLGFVQPISGGSGVTPFLGRAWCWWCCCIDGLTRLFCRIPAKGNHTGTILLSLSCYLGLEVLGGRGVRGLDSFVSWESVLLVDWYNT